MSGRSTDTVAGFLAHAHTIETEAVERYELLADQMDVHNNPEVAELFRKLARIEAKHAAEIETRARSEGIELPRLSPWEFDWGGWESPESAEIDAAHYRMTPHHALTMALRSEERARDFFRQTADAAPNNAVRTLASDFAEDEDRHVQLMRDWLADYPEPESDWDEDPDPPVWPE